MNNATIHQSVDKVLAGLMAQRLEPGLYIVATPIGNLGDITLRALSVLARADVICCEDTRHSRKLTQHYGIDRPLMPFHEHNEDQLRARIIEAAQAGKAVALISDAGTPLVSDPGFKLVREARALGITVTALPGACAPIAALASAGLPTDCFYFEGFLPPKRTARRARLAALRAIPGTLVFFETGPRLAEALTDFAEVLGPRDGAIARELTKLHEQIVVLPIERLAEQFAVAPVKGEIVVLIGPAAKPHASDDEITRALHEALREQSVRDAAKTVAEELGAARGRVYDLALKIRNAE